MLLEELNGPTPVDINAGDDDLGNVELTENTPVVVLAAPDVATELDDVVDIESEPKNQSIRRRFSVGSRRNNTVNAAVMIAINSERLKCRLLIDVCEL